MCAANEDSLFRADPSPRVPPGGGAARIRVVAVGPALERPLVFGEVVRLQRMRGLPGDLAHALLGTVRPAVQTETVVVERGRYRPKHRHTEPQLCPLKAAASACYGISQPTGETLPGLWVACSRQATVYYT